MTVLLAIEKVLQLQTVLQVTKALSIFEDGALLQCLRDEAIDLGCHFYLLTDSLEHQSLHIVHRRLNHHKLVLALVELERRLEVEA